MQALGVWETASLQAPASTNPASRRAEGRTRVQALPDWVWASRVAPTALPAFVFSGTVFVTHVLLHHRNLESTAGLSA